MTFRPVRMDDVIHIIEPELRKWLADPDEAGIEQVIADCHAGRAQAMQSEEGVIVVQIQVNRRHDGRELHCWWGSSTADEHGAFERAQPAVNRVAKDLSCKTIVFHSQRVGWVRKAARAGFRVRNITLSRAVP